MLIAFLATELGLVKEKVQNLQSQLEAAEVLSLLTTFAFHTCICTAPCLLKYVLQSFVLF